MRCVARRAEARGWGRSLAAQRVPAPRRSARGCGPAEPFAGVSTDHFIRRPLGVCTQRSCRVFFVFFMAHRLSPPAGARRGGTGPQAIRASRSTRAERPRDFGVSWAPGPIQRPRRRVSYRRCSSPLLNSCAGARERAGTGGSKAAQRVPSARAVPGRPAANRGAAPCRWPCRDRVGAGGRSAGCGTTARRAPPRHPRWRECVDEVAGSARRAEPGKARPAPGPKRGYPSWFTFLPPAAAAG